MISQFCSGGAGLTLLLFTVGSTPASAETVAFRNDTNAPVVVQTACVIQGVVRRDKPYLVNPMERTPSINLPGKKLTTIYDGRMPNRILYQGIIVGGNEDLYLSIQPDVGPFKVRLERLKAPSPR